jgi:signal transduction histidine kinase
MHPIAPQPSPDQSREEFSLADLAAPLLVGLALACLAWYSFLWFHTLVELFCVVVGAALYLIARYSHVFNRNNFLLFLAQGFFWAGCLDAIHAMAYSGVGLVPGNDPNPATQLWLCARLMEATTLLLAPRYLDQRTIAPWTFGAFAMMAVAATGLVFLGGFPDAFIVGRGLTPFKIGAEYLIIGLLLLAAGQLWQHRAQLDPTLYRMLLCVVALTIISEFSFTLYVSVFGLANLFGHIAKFWAFWLLLLIISRRMLAEPFRILSGNATSFDAIPMPVLVLDPQGHVLSCNEAARQKHPSGGIGHALHDIWHPASINRPDCAICNALAGGHGISTVLHDIDSNEWSGVRLHPVRQDQQTSGYIYFQTDITERKRAEEKLAQAEKLELIGRMTGGLAHDFNNLMMMVLGSLSMLDKRVAADEKAKAHVALAKQAAQRATDVTKSLLAVARQQPLEPRVLNIRQVIAEMMPLLRQSVGNAIVVTESHCARCAATRCERCILALVDPAGLSNTILNLVINARDAMPQGGNLVIQTDVRTLTATEAGAPGDLAPGQYVIVSISDTGAGMSPQVAMRAFEPFFTTKGPGVGTGLGLAMVYGFARQSDGTATLYTQPDIGTTIHLYLPAAGEPAIASTDHEQDGHLAAGNGQRILLVDDEAGLLALTREWLESLGYQVTVAHCPPAAIDHLGRETFDLLLTDVVMPGYDDGLQLARDARALQPGIRVLISSGLSGEVLRDEYAGRLLEKPYAKYNLALAVGRALV